MDSSNISCLTWMSYWSSFLHVISKVFVGFTSIRILVFHWSILRSLLKDFGVILQGKQTKRTNIVYLLECKKTQKRMSNRHIKLLHEAFYSLKFLYTVRKITCFSKCICAFGQLLDCQAWVGMNQGCLNLS